MVRQFLLGDVDDLERRRLESLFISNDGLRERILAAEEDLVEDYLEESLTAADRAKFVAQYGHTPEQRRMLRIARSIKEYAVAEATVTQRGTAAIPKWRSILSSLWPRKPIWVIPIAATLSLVLVVTVVWLLGLNSRRARENNRRIAIEQELADLNSPSSLRESRPQALSVVLPPVSVRSVEPHPELTPGPDTRIVELRLLLTQKEQYPSYRAVLRRVGNAEQFTISNLHVENSSGGNAIRVNLPTHLLPPGLYQVLLSGVTGDGAPGTVEEYTFTIGA
jgi:hypothetical protein